MTVFAVMRDPMLGSPELECVYNRELTTSIGRDDQRFIVMSEELHEKYGVDYDAGEVLLYAPDFRPDIECMWVGQTIDFDFSEL